MVPAPPHARADVNDSTTAPVSEIFLTCMRGAQTEGRKTKSDFFSRDTMNHPYFQADFLGDTRTGGSATTELIAILAITQVALSRARGARIFPGK